MFVCPQCSSPNPLDHRFCQQCGFQLVQKLAVVEEVADQTGQPTNPQLHDPEPSVPPTLALDSNSRYRIISSSVAVLDTKLVQVLDAQPKQPSALQEFMAQQPPIDSKAYLGKTPSDYPEWELWERGGITLAARPYLALQPALASIPTLCDAWKDPHRSVLVMNAPTTHQQLTAICQDDQLPRQELQGWLEEMLQLWNYLQPWAVRSSLLHLDNLYVNADRNLYLRCLINEPSEHPPTPNDLAKVWQQLGQSQDLDWQQSLTQLIATENLTVDNLHQGLYQLSATAVAEFTELAEPTTSLLLAPHLLGVEAAAATDVGRQREHNEDYYSIESSFHQCQTPENQAIAGRGLYILCDGMGGHAAGEVASKMTIDKLKEYWAKHWTDDILPSEEEIIAAIHYANQALFEINQGNSSSGSGRMGTTLVMVMLQDNQVAIAHVGDSRCYLLEVSSMPVQITLDHEVGQREMLRGVEPEIAYGRPDAYQLTQAIGPRDQSAISPDVQIFSLREDTLILIASDGLTDRDLVEENGEVLLRPLVNRQISVQQGVKQLVEFANGYNGHDNITAIAIRIQVGKT
jgi:protein phosphatase